MEKGGERKIESQTTCLGIDVSKHNCAFAAMDADGAVLESGKYPNTRADAAKFADNMRATYGDCRAICESTARMWIKTYETLAKCGMPIVVANPLRLGLRKSGAKTDAKDAARLANKLRMNDLEGAICYVYDEDTMRIIDLLRQMTLLKQERTRYLNREHSLCEKYDYPIKTGSDTSGERHQSYLHSLKLRPGDMVLMEQYVSSVRHINSQLEMLRGLVRRDAAKSRDALLIMSMTGFDAYSALLLAASIDGIGRFKGPKQLVSFLGLCPTTYQSGQRITHGRMKKDRDGALTHIMMNAAMVAKQHDEHIAAIYERYAKRHPPLIARSHVANIMATYIYYMLKNGETYRHANDRLYQSKLDRLKS